MSSLAEKLASGIARILPTGNQGDDPLVSIKSAQRWVEKLPAGDAFKSQQAFFAEFKRFNETTTDFTKDRLAIFMLLDEKSRDLQDTLVRQYLRNPRMSRQVESQLWHAVYGLSWEIARGYHTFVLHISRQAKQNQPDAAIPLLCMRAIRAFGQLFKWRTIRYLPASEKLWLRLHNLYQISENQGFQRQLQTAYSEDSSECSCESAYLHILMMNLANSGTLYPKQLDLLDHWLCTWHTQLQLDGKLDSNTHNFVVDLSTDRGPRRVRKPDTNTPMRFWSTASLVSKIQGLEAGLKKGHKPAQLGLGDTVHATESLELLDHLAHQWASLEDREQRRAPRATIKRLVDVAHGLKAIFNQVKVAEAPSQVSPYGIGLNYDEEDDVQVYGFITNRTRERVSHMHAPAAQLSPDVERWVMHDESEFGYGAIVESRDKDWLRVGALIGIKTHDADEWKIGIVRRLTRLDSDTSSVGIETLPEVPELAMLYDTGTQGYSVSGAENNSSNLPNTSLLLTDEKGKHSIILDPVHFLPGKVCQIHGNPALALMAMGAPIEHSEGWIRIVAEPVKG